MNELINDPRIVRGMEKQLQFRRNRLNAGEKPIGWKVGFGAPASLQRLQLEAPLVGFLTDKTLIPSGATVPIGGWAKPAIEPEVAVYLGKGLFGKVDRTAVQDAIAAMGPALELADIDFPPDDVERILAENIYNRHVILGNADSARLGGRLEGLVGKISHNTNELPPVTDLQELTGDILDIVGHVANLLFAFGEKLRAGEFIIAGAIVPPVQAEAKDIVRYTLAPIDTVEVSLI